MSIRGKANGLLHQEGSQKRSFEADLQPQARVPRGDTDFLESFLSPEEDREIYTVSGFQDLIHRTRGVWRINFILDTIKGNRLLTLMDETSGSMLVTIQLPKAQPEDQVSTVTPLARYLKQNSLGASANLWKTLVDDDF